MAESGKGKGIAAKNIGRILSILKRRYPGEFVGSNITEEPFQVLIGTVLSHQTRDERTLIGSRRLFSKYPDAKSMAGAKASALRELIKPVGMYNVKAKRIKEISRLLMERYNGSVPRNYEEIVALPGVGRKTANILFSYAYGNPDYIAVDTHVHKVSNRLGLVKTSHPDKTEAELYGVVPKKQWKRVNELFVQHGQTVCKARPRCKECPISRYCDYFRNLKA